jgi:hypothetical protein
MVRVRGVRRRELVVTLERRGEPPLRLAVAVSLREDRPQLVMAVCDVGPLLRVVGIGAQQCLGDRHALP